MQSWVQRSAGVLFVLAVISGLAFIWEQRDMPSFGSIQDDAVYMVSARAISQGDGYRLIHLPNQPVQTKYPPFVPAAVAAIWAVSPDFPGNLASVAMAGSMVFLACMGLCYITMRNWGFSVGLSAVLSALAATNPLILKLSGSVMTEVPFMTLLLATLWFTRWSSNRAAKWAAFAGAVAGLAYLTRTAALPLIVTVPAILWLQCRRRHAIAFALAMAPALAGWQLWVMSNRQQASDLLTLYYTNYAGLELATVTWQNIGQMVYINLDTLLTGMGNQLIPLIGESFFGHQFARLVAVAALLGAYRLSWRSGQWHYGAFALANCLILLVWHYPPNERFTLPLLPLLLAGLWVECEHLVELIRSAWNHNGQGNRFAALAVAAALACFGLFFFASTVEARFLLLPQFEAQAREQSTQLKNVFAKVREVTPANSTILSDQDSLLHLHTGRPTYRTIIPPAMLYQETTDAIQQELAKMSDAAGRQWDYALITKADWRHSLSEQDCTKLHQRISARTDLTIVFDDGYATLYQRKTAARVAMNSLQH